MENNLFEDMPNQEEFDFRIELVSIDAIQRKARISFTDQWTFTQYVKSRLFTTLKEKKITYVFALYELNLSTLGSYLYLIICSQHTGFLIAFNQFFTTIFAQRITIAFYRFLQNTRLISFNS